MWTGEATETIEIQDPLPRVRLVRFERAAAIHLVEHVEERLSTPREPRLRDRFAGRSCAGEARDFAQSLLSWLGGLARWSARSAYQAGGPVCRRPAERLSGWPGLLAAGRRWWRPVRWRHLGVCAAGKITS